MTATTYGQSPRYRSWHRALLNEGALTIGSVTFGYDDVAQFERSTSAERDWDGQLLCSALYGLGSAIFLCGIMIGSLDYKFMIAVVFLAAICFMSMCDALATPTVVVHRIAITLEDGRRFVFADGDERIVDVVARRLRLAGAGEV